MTDTACARDDVARCVQRFLDDLAVVRSANSVRAYAADVQRWIAFCQSRDTHPFEVRPRMAIEFIRQESERGWGKDKTVGTRSIVRRLSAIRQWYAYLALEPDVTGVHGNPIPVGSAARAGAGIIAGKPALLRYDRPLPAVLSADEMDRFLACLTATQFRDRAIVWLLKDGGMRIGELLGLRLGDINWSKRLLTVRATKNRTERLVPISQEAVTILADYVRLERPKTLPHDTVFVNLGHRSSGQPFTYRSWVAVCEKARQAAETPRVHAHAFRHTYATNMAESGMPLDTLKRVLGHQHLETLAIYNHVRDSRLQREYQEAMTVAGAARSDGRPGYLHGEVPRSIGGPSRRHFTWGRTAPSIVATFERFLTDLRSTRRPGTVQTYVSVLRRFGDWLGEFDPSVTTLSEIRRLHIEAYKQMIAHSTVGEYGNPTSCVHVGTRLGQPLSSAHQVRCLSCVKTFFDLIEVLEYPERPGRPLFLRGDIKRADRELPRFIPDGDFHRFVATVEQLTPKMVTALSLSLPYERARAILGLLLAAGLRAGELCRLDTGCIVTAQDAATQETTYWLRVPVGKLQNDRMVPVQPALVELIDAWMGKRGPQPILWDERTNKARDYLFAWQGATVSPHGLNDLIAAICSLGGVLRYTSHQFRHTLAVQWRKNGMRLESISRMLGHKSLQMTLRYAAVMPETVRKEFDTAFAAIDEEYRTTAQVRVHLSPEAHLAASQQWRESLWVDLGIGFCGLSAYLPCQNRLACLPCPHFIATRENLPVYGRQRDNLIELRVLGETLPTDRKDEIDDAVSALDQRITEVGDQLQTDEP